jgi:glutamine synthetase
LTLRGHLDLSSLAEAVEKSLIDTVLVVITDMQGRLQGKRLDAGYFLDEAAGDSVEGCSYLMAVDVDMNTVGGYSMSSWETGYRDFVMRPDLATLRLVPWHTKTAICHADLTWQDGAPVEAAPRQVLQRQCTRLADRGWSVSLIRREMAAAGMPVESVKGECNLGQHEVAFRYGELVSKADEHVLYKTGAKEIAAQEGRSVTFMAKFDHRAGNSCHIHLSLRDVDGTPLFAGDGPHGTSGLCDQWLAGMLATLPDFTLLMAPNVNSYKRFAPASFAPTAIAWGRDNRTCAFRLVGRGPSLRVECRVPGGDVNPYLALAALVAGGLYGVVEGLDPVPPFSGNAYAANLPRIPRTLRESAERFESSKIVHAALGEEVVAHYANMARVELDAFDAAVTDWERFRCFERF